MIRPAYLILVLSVIGLGFVLMALPELFLPPVCLR